MRSMMLFASLLLATGVAGAEAKSLPKQAKEDCEFNSRLYRSFVKGAIGKNSYQELQFVDGVANGTVVLTEYRQDKAVWISHGEYECSNGASICRVRFPLMVRQSAGPDSLEDWWAYETVDNVRNLPEFVVIPAFRQDVYMSERDPEMSGKAYGGLVADFLNGFKLNKDELTLPANVYRYAGCKPSEKTPKDNSGTVGALDGFPGGVLRASGEATGDAPLNDSMFKNCEKWGPSSACKKK